MSDQKEYTATPICENRVRLNQINTTSPTKRSTTMRSITRFACLCSNPMLWRSLSSSSRHFQHKKTPSNTDQTSMSSLFKDITHILTLNNPTPDEVRNESVKSNNPLHDCTQPVRANAQEKPLVSKDEPDVSPIVHQITSIVRAEHGGIPMEQRLENSGFRFEPNVVEKVLKRCFKVPHLGLRFFTWVQLRKEFCHTTEVYNSMLYIAGEMKDLELMEKLERDMEIKACHKDIKTWTILVSQYGKAKSVVKALLVFDKMRKSGFEPDVKAYRTMVRLLLDAGKGDIAFEFYKEMVGKEMVLDYNLYRMVLNYVAGLGNIDDIHFVISNMITIGKIPEGEVYSFVSKSFCVAGRIREALVLIQDLKNKEIPIDFKYFEILVKGLCKAGRIDDALEIVDIMKRSDLVDEKVYGIIINGYLRKNDLLKANVMFERMKECGYTPTVSTYTELMQHLFKSKEYQKGCELYDEMLERGIQPDNVAIMAMVGGHVRQNNISKAWKVFKSMEKNGTKPTWKSYSIFIKELCRVSRTDVIFTVLSEMQALKIDIGNEIFGWVISCMEKKGEKSNVEKVKQMQKTYNRYVKEEEVCSNEGIES